MSLLLGLKRGATQSVVALGLVNLGSVYRKYCRKNQCGIPTFSTDGNSVTLQQSGIYHITATLTFSSSVAGLVVFQLTENGTAIPNALASETITTAVTEVKTTTIDYYVLVDKCCVLGTPSTNAKTISIQNTGIGATITNVVFNVEKVV